MNNLVRHISRIRDEFDTVICGVNGVLTDGRNVFSESIDVLIKLYQSGKKIALASNSGMRVEELFLFLKRNNVPMNIFYAMITAGEIAHFYLKNQKKIGNTYYSLSDENSRIIAGLDYEKVDSAVMADFLLAEQTHNGVDAGAMMPVLEQAVNLNLPLLCVGNDTMVLTENGAKQAAGMLAEQYAMIGGNIISFGKPDLHIALYLTESLEDIDASRCLFIGDNMATDMRLGTNFGGKNLLITSGVHQLKGDLVKQTDELSTGFGLNVDYCMEKLQW